MLRALFGNFPIAQFARWSLTALAAGCLCPASMAAETDCPAPEPDTAPSTRFQCARLLAQNGEFLASINEYEKLSSEYPDNVDYLFGEAQARFWSGDRAGALELLPRARELAPAYEDLWRLEYRVLQSSRGSDAEQRTEAFRSAALQQFPEASWLQEVPSPEQEKPGFGWEFGLNVDSLDNGAADWQHTYARVDRRSPNDGVVYLAIAEHRRFSLADKDVGVGGSFKPAANWIVDGGIHLSPDADFLPEAVAGMGVSRVFENGWIAGLEGRQRRYANDTVNTFGLEVERYFGPFRAAWQLQNTRLGSASSFVQIGVLNYYAESGSRYGVTAAAGDEVEIVAPGQLLEMDISAIALTGSHPLGERLSILWRVGTHRQGSFYRRNTVGFSIAGEF